MQAGCPWLPGELDTLRQLHVTLVHEYLDGPGSAMQASQEPVRDQEAPSASAPPPPPPPDGDPLPTQ